MGVPLLVTGCWFRQILQRRTGADTCWLLVVGLSPYKVKWPTPAY
jgi:hypothetical protein